MIGPYLGFLQMYPIYKLLHVRDVTIVVDFEPTTLQAKKNLYFCIK